MKEIYVGGELPVSADSIPRIFFGHSGRAGIRAFCRAHPGRKVLLPDFLCYIIVDLMEEEGMPYGFYHIREDLSIDIGSVESQEFDVLFVIDYYGTRHENLRELDLGDAILLQDGVFDLKVTNHYEAPRWFGFNSLRKISRLADGSVIKTNLPLQNPIHAPESPFAAMKYEAKAVKHRALATGDRGDERYLRMLEDAEKALDAEKNLCRISEPSMALLWEMMENYEPIRQRRLENFQTLDETLRPLRVFGAIPEFPSFYVIRTPHRDRLREHLFSKNVFLPVHWPRFGPPNPLYDEVLSIPVFAEYTPGQMAYIAEQIRAFLSQTPG